MCWVHTHTCRWLIVSLWSTGFVHTKGTRHRQQFHHINCTFTSSNGNLAFVSARCDGGRTNVTTMHAAVCMELHSNMLTLMGYKSGYVTNRTIAVVRWTSLITKSSISVFLSGIIPNMHSISVIHFVAAACTFAKNRNNLGAYAGSLHRIVPFQRLQIGTASVRRTDDSNKVTQPILSEFSCEEWCL